LRLSLPSRRTMLNAGGCDGADSRDTVAERVSIRSTAACSCLATTRAARAARVSSIASSIVGSSGGAGAAGAGGGLGTVAGCCCVPGGLRWRALRRACSVQPMNLAVSRTVLPVLSVRRDASMRFCVQIRFIYRYTPVDNCVPSIRLDPAALLRRIGRSAGPDTSGGRGLLRTRLGSTARSRRQLSRRRSASDDPQFFRAIGEFAFRAL
jgi:hypothetical protein